MPGADLGLFVNMSKSPQPTSIQSAPLQALINFILSELKRAFEIGCLIFVPLLKTDFLRAGRRLAAGCGLDGRKLWRGYYAAVIYEPPRDCSLRRFFTW
jgi:hypothetical protein